MMPNFGTFSPDGHMGPSKPELRRQLAEAMENTVALQEGRPLVAPKPPASTKAPKAPKIAPAASVGAPVHVSQETREPPSRPPGFSAHSNEVEKTNKAPVPKSIYPSLEDLEGLPPELIKELSASSQRLVAAESEPSTAKAASFYANPIQAMPADQLGRATKPLAPMSFSEETTANPAIRRAPSVPTADQVGRAIVAACRETGASPLEINGGMGMAIVHARYYAMHAIEHCFPGLSSRVYARVVGAGKNFYSASKQSVIRMVLPNRRQAAWWDEAAYARVIAAVERSGK